MGHIFGLSHCNFYECAMNSSSFVSEVDEQPLFLCPICLRKLQKFLKFRLMDRYRKLREALTNMVPCYVEEISVCRKNFDVVNENVGVSEESRDVGPFSSPFEEFSRGEQDAAPLRHICIEVTRERNEGYDLINVEYTQSISDRTANVDHECQFTEALGKLDEIGLFLNRH